MRWILCKTCADKVRIDDYLEDGRFVLRLSHGKARVPTAEQRQVTITTADGERQIIDMGTEAYNCDRCNAAIKPRDAAMALTTVDARHNKPAPMWENGFLFDFESVTHSEMPLPGAGEQ